MASAVAGQPDVIAFTNPRSPAAEAYRALRTNIQFAAVDRPIRRLLMTSSGPDEGKSAAVANLAVTMAQADAKVIVVDCDLRRPAQHELFHLRNTTGLTNLFLGQKTLSQNGGGPGPIGDPPLQATTVPNLWVLTSGPIPPNPAELLGSARMLAILEDLSARADIVLLDAPPVVAVTDAAVLSAKADACLLVVGAGTVKRDLARRARAQLEAVHANVLGLVVSNAPFDPQAFASYYEADGQ